MTTFDAINAGFARVFQPGRLSLGLVVPIDHYGIASLPDLNRMTARVQQAEALGFGAVWLRDIPFNVPSFGDTGQVYDPFVFATWLAAKTERIALASGSIILPLRHPAHVAKSAASIDQLSGGRWIMGVASGDRPEEYPATATDYEHRGAAFRDHFDYIRAMADDYPRLSNSAGQLRGDIDCLPKPVGQRIPMAVTGASQQPMDWVAKHADAWITYPRPPALQARVIQDWQSRVHQLRDTPVPVSQSLYIDLVRDAPAQPIPIHLGWRLGIQQLHDLLAILQASGVNHVALNLRFNTAPIEDTLTELAAHLFPTFGCQEDTP